MEIISPHPAQHTISIWVVLFKCEDHCWYYCTMCFHSKIYKEEENRFRRAIPNFQVTSEIGQVRLFEITGGQNHDQDVINTTLVPESITLLCYLCRCSHCSAGKEISVYDLLHVSRRMWIKCRKRWPKTTSLLCYSCPQLWTKYSLEVCFCFCIL